MPVSASVYGNLVNDELEKICKEDILGNALFWAVTKRVVVIPNRRFGTTYRYRNVGKELLLRAA
jgi:hypothetical protein